jgi:UDP-glucose:(heptosyl)LPS alpha-1,3-glucosyltransferase
MQIALIRQRYTAFGGAERFVANALEALKSQGAQLTLVTRHWQARAGLDAIVCDPFYLGSLWRDWSFARAVCRELARRDFDLVQSHERIACCDVYRAGDGVHAQWLANRRAARGAAGRLALALNPYHRYVLAAERGLFTSPRLRAVICNSRMVKEEIRRHFGVAEERLHVIYSGVDTAAFHPELRTRHRQAVRERHGIANDVPVFLHVGSGFERKGIAQLLAALARLPGTAHALIVGKDKHLRRFQRLADHLGLAGRVHFTGGLTDVKPYYGAADVFCLPTLYDPFPNAALEAMASGLPVVTSAQCGAAELIEPGNNGFVCNALDVTALAEAMRRAAERSSEMGVAARRIVEPLTLAAMSARLVELYQQLLGAR